jgi:DNA-binding transcriptional LysR family regulator
MGWTPPPETASNACMRRIPKCASCTSTRMPNLAKREADIAVRSVRPNNPDLVARRLARWSMALFASNAYFEQHGKPVTGFGFAGHDLVVYQGNWTGNRSPTLAGEPMHTGRIVSTFNSSLMRHTAVKAGLGLGELPIHLTEHDRLVQIWPEPSRGAAYEIRLVTHQDLRHTARIAAMIEGILSAFEDHTTHKK